MDPPSSRGCADRNDGHLTACTFSGRDEAGLDGLRLTPPGIYMCMSVCIHVFI